MSLNRPDHGRYEGKLVEASPRAIKYSSGRTIVVADRSASVITQSRSGVRALQERERVGSATDSQRESWYLRKAELFDRLAAAEPREPAYAEAAANARCQLEELP